VQSQQPRNAGLLLEMLGEIYFVFEVLYPVSEKAHAGDERGLIVLQLCELKVSGFGEAAESLQEFGLHIPQGFYRQVTRAARRRRSVAIIVDRHLR
jgi:hypothetical protein